MASNYWLDIMRESAAFALPHPNPRKYFRIDHVNHPGCCGGPNHKNTNCEKLTSIDLPENMHLLGENAYNLCTSLRSMTIRCASSNIEFGPNVFQNWEAISTIRMYPWLYPKLFRAMRYHPPLLSV